MITTPKVIRLYRLARGSTKVVAYIFVFFLLVLAGPLLAQSGRANIPGETSFHQLEL